MALTKLKQDRSINYVHQDAGRRNMVINGAMNVAQRNSSSAVTISGDGVYTTVDRFKGRTFGGSGRFSMQQVTDTPNKSFTNSLKLVVTTTDTSGTNGYSIEHVIEDNAIHPAGFGDSDANPVTLSFWVKSSVTGSYSASLRGRHDTGTPANVQEYSISSANTWEHKKITFPAYTGSDLLTHLLLDFGLGKQTSKTTSTLGTWQTTNFVFGNNQVDWQSNSGATFYLCGVQLEVGNTATPFEHRSYGEELALCQRYFYAKTREGSGNNHIVGMSYWSSTTSNECVLQHPVHMRSAPSISVDTIGDFYGLIPQQAWQQASAVSLNEGGPNTTKVSFTCASNGSFSVDGRRSSVVGIRGDSGRLKMDAEL